MKTNTILTLIQPNLTPVSLSKISTPLGIGDKHEYVGIDDEGEDFEHINIEVLDKTKSIQGLTCRVINDIVTEACDEESCDVIEDTDDW